MGMKTEYIIKIDGEPDIMGNYPLKDKPQELIRCKDCKYSSYHRNRFDNQYVCTRNTDKWGKVPECDLKGHRANWFCADGERKSADEKLMEEMDADPLG